MHSHKEKHAKVLLSWMEPSNKYQGHVLGPTGHLNCETSQIKAFVPVSGFQLLCFEFLFHSRRREIRLKSCQDQTSQFPQFISPRTANNYAQTIKPNGIQFKSFRLKYQPSCIGIWKSHNPRLSNAFPWPKLKATNNELIQLLSCFGILRNTHVWHVSRQIKTHLRQTSFRGFVARTVTTVSNNKANCLRVCPTTHQ